MSGRTLSSHNRRKFHPPLSAPLRSALATQVRPAQVRAARAGRAEAHRTPAVYISGSATNSRPDFRHTRRYLIGGAAKGERLEGTDDYRILVGF